MVTDLKKFCKSPPKRRFLTVLPHSFASNVTRTIPNRNDLKFWHNPCYLLNKIMVILTIVQVLNRAYKSCKFHIFYHFLSYMYNMQCYQTFVKVLCHYITPNNVIFSVYNLFKITFVIQPFFYHFLSFKSTYSFMYKCLKHTIISSSFHMSLDASNMWFIHVYLLI